MVRCLFIMSPETNDFDDVLGLIDLIDKAVLDIHSSGIGSEKITDKLLKRWGSLSLLRINKLPSHQSSSFEHSVIFSLSLS
jgi:hypothetical protein